MQERLAQERQIKISVIGRISGRRFTFPVWFVMEGSNLCLLPVKGSETQWYKNVLRSRAIRMIAKSHAGEFRATPVTKARAVSAVVKLFGQKYKARIVKMLYSKFDVAVRVKLT